MKKKIKKIILLFSIIILSISCNQSNKEYEEAVDEYLSKLYSNSNSSNNVRVFPDKRIFYGAVLPKVEKRTLNGKNIDFRKLPNEYSLINTWFLECKPCIEEIPVLNKINELENIDVISICKNDSLDLDSSVYYKNIKYETIANETLFLKDTLNKTFGYPTNILVDKKGVIQSIYSQIVEDSEDYKHILKMIEK